MTRYVQLFLLVCIAQHQLCDYISRAIRESTDEVYSSIPQKAADIVKTILRISRVKTDPMSPLTTPVAVHEVMLKRLVDWLIIHTLLIITLLKLLTTPLRIIQKDYMVLYIVNISLCYSDS